MDVNSLNALLAAVAAICALWSVRLLLIQRQDDTLRRIAQAVDDVRDAAEQVKAAHEEEAPRADRNRAYQRFISAQHRFRSAYAAGPSSRRLRHHQHLRRDLEALLSSRAWDAAARAPRVLGGLRQAMEPVGGELRAAVVRRLRPRRERRLLRLEDIVMPGRPSSSSLAHVVRDDEGTLEMVVPLRRGGFVRSYRADEDLRGSWVADEPFGVTQGVADHAAVTTSNFGPRGRVELIATAQGRLLHYVGLLAEPAASDGPAWSSEPDELGSGVVANPAMVQSTFGIKGNFELVAPVAGGGFVHFWRDNDRHPSAWIATREVVAAGEGLIDAVALVQSNYGPHGHLEVIARRGADLVHYWRDDAEPGRWWPAGCVSGAFRELELTPTGIPGFIQSKRYGGVGNFELVAPLSDGRLAHLWRDNDDPAVPWRLAAVFGGRGAPAEWACVVESRSRSLDGGNLRVYVRVGERIRLWVRSGASARRSRDASPAEHWKEIDQRPRRRGGQKRA